MKKAIAYEPRVPQHAIDVITSGRPRRGRLAFDLEESFTCSTAALESYAFARWEPVIYDAMIVAASIEYADRTFARSKLGWRRDFVLQIPVLEPERWTNPAVYNSLQDAACFLTGDFWSFEFVQRDGATPHPPQDSLKFNVRTDAVMAFSDGMDSRSVAGLLEKELEGRILRVRVGSKKGGKPVKGERIPFAIVPYNVTTSGESGGRSRGFKFALISGIAAYLAEANEIFLPESGQGIFGPALVTTAHTYPDYRSHPLFTARMEKFLFALLKKPIKFTFPRLWSTKGETLRAYVNLPNSDDWKSTRSCWRDARHSSLNGQLMQCGICAACMLRRMSIFAAGLKDDDSLYICGDLSAPSLKRAINSDFAQMSPAFREYAIAGVQHLDHMADMILPINRPALRRHSILMAQTLELSASEIESLLVSMFERHAAEWHKFLEKMGPHSFVKQWTRAE